MGEEPVKSKQSLTEKMLSKVLPVTDLFINTEFQIRALAYVGAFSMFGTLWILSETGKETEHASKKLKNTQACADAY